MCGFVGVCSFIHDSRGWSNRLRQSAGLIAHRGPDDESFYESQTFSVGFRRLKIIDLSDQARQPMTDSSGRYTLVFNGEIYNYLELREELVSLGHEFKTKSDTEVLLKGFVQWGEQCLKHLNGMFAIGWWDSETGQLLLARDRFGEKPLFYVPTDDGIVFASEIKALFPLLRTPPQPSIDAIYSYMEFGDLDLAPNTFFSGVYSLPQASKLVVTKTGMQESAYWSLGESNDIVDDPSEKFRELFLQSLRLRSRSDVPVGTCLSGGLDSSSIACGLSHLENERQIEPTSRKTFSACYEKYDESPQILATVKKSGSQSFLTTPSPASLDELSELISYHDEPFHSFAAFASYCVMKLAKQNDVIVVLNGQGADESLAGYNSYVVPHILDTYFGKGLMAAKDAAKGAFELTGQPSNKLLTNAMKYAAKTKLSPVLRGLGIRSRRQPTRCYDTWRSGAISGATRLSHIKPSHISGHLKKDLYSSLFTAKLPLYLRVEDRNSMANSIESRLPFLDHRLVEFVFSVLPWKFISDGKNKLMLREGMGDLLPIEVTRRKDKFGFPIPQSQWLFETLSEEIRERLASPSAGLQALFDTERLNQLFDQHAACQESQNDMSQQSRFWFRLISLDLWFRHVETLSSYCGEPASPSQSDESVGCSNG